MSWILITLLTLTSIGIITIIPATILFCRMETNMPRFTITFWLTSMILGLGGVPFTADRYHYEMVTYEDYICNIKTVKGINTNLDSKNVFVIGCGSLESKTYYYYFEDLGNNKSQLGKVLTSNTLIIETDDVDPKLVKAKYKNGNEHYEMYVPLGTIKVQWEL